MRVATEMEDFRVVHPLDDQPEQKRQQHHHRPHLFDKGQTEQHANRDPPAPAFRLVEPVPERQGRRRPDQKAWRVGVDQVGLTVKPRHE